MNTEKYPGEVGYNGERKPTPLKHHFNKTSVRQAIEKLRKGEELISQENELLLTTDETAEVLTLIRGSKVSKRYLPQLIRDDRLQPAAPGSGRSYLYRMADVRQVKFGKAGIPKKRKKIDA